MPRVQSSRQSRAGSTTSSYFPSTVTSRAATPYSVRYTDSADIPVQSTEESDQVITSSCPAPSHTGSAMSRSVFTGSRPTTASGRKSRATTVSSMAGDSQVICAVCEGRGVSPSVGVAFLNISYGEAVVSQLCDNPSYVKTVHGMQLVDPSVILITPTATGQNTLCNLIRQFFTDATIHDCDRAFWSEPQGQEYIDRLALEDDIPALKVAIEGKYYAVCAFAAILSFLNNQSTAFTPHSLRVRYEPPDDTMMIDISAIKSLELIQSVDQGAKQASLLGLLNSTTTPMGLRLLRTNILQPSTQVERVIEPRLEAVEELVSNVDMFNELRSALKPFFDVEKLLTKYISMGPAGGIAQFEQHIERILMIKGFLEAILGLHAALGPATSPLLSKARDICSLELTNEMLMLIKKDIEDDVTYAKSPLDLRNQKAYAVRPGVSGFLDVSRQTYKELTGAIHDHVEELNTRNEISAQLKYDNSRKYWLLLKFGSFNDTNPPKELVNMVTKKKHVECQTMDLVKFNLKLTSVSNEISMRSSIVVESLSEELAENISTLFRMCESLGIVDMVVAFAHLASTHDYVRPNFGSSLALKAARHPIHDKKLAGRFVPNDYYATENHRFQIITGCNMSGKSTYIRSCALLQIMAQIGSFVPAEFARFSIIQNIFARLTMDDSVEANLSTFSVEMREMAFILRNVDDKSLVLIDELGRGTGTKDGLAIALAISEALLQNNAYVWFATHFADLAKAFEELPGVLTLHLRSRFSTSDAGIPKLTMMYKIETGVLDVEENYGIHLARAMGLPSTMTDKAQEVAQASRLKRRQDETQTAAYGAAQGRKLVMRLYDSLKQAKEFADTTAVMGYLKRLQEQFIDQMEALDLNKTEGSQEAE